jgi:hypothetical protein
VTTDKASHYFASSTLQLVTGDLLTCVASGAAYEVAQSRGGGYGSRYDFGYDAAGCASAMAWRWGSRRLAQARRR